MRGKEREGEGEGEEKGGKGRRNGEEERVGIKMVIK